jgi:rhodanese-related sulfurtransferase
MMLKVLLALSMGIVTACAQEVRLLSLQQNGSLTWTNSQVGGNYAVQWAASADGPWSASWQALSSIAGTNQVLSRPVPMLYRVVWMPPAITNVSAAAALMLITNRAADTNFFILDVRTASEYNLRHVRGALNLDFYSASFRSDLAQLDRWRPCLVYCASGSRSAQAVVRMRELGFMEVINMTVGFSALAQLPGAAPWLEP